MAAFVPFKINKRPKQSDSPSPADEKKAPLDYFHIRQDTLPVIPSDVNVLLLENIHPKAANHLKRTGFTVDICNDKLAQDELIKKLQSIHILGVRNKTVLNADVLKACPDLLCIGHFCIGTDKTDMKTATSLGMCVFNSPFHNSRSVAELVLCGAIALARKVGDQNMIMHTKQEWNKTARGCFEIRGKIMGIVGYGNVGSQLSVLCESVGMSVIYYDKQHALAMGNAKQVDSMDEVLRNSDFVSLHVPLNKYTVNLIDEKEIRSMKQGACLMNCTRGGVVNEEAVAKALHDGHLGGAYFDVFATEPLVKTCPLIGCPNAILTPHIGGSTMEAQRNIAIDVAEKFEAFLYEGQTKYSLNIPPISMGKVKPNMDRVGIYVKNAPGLMIKINQILAKYSIHSIMMRSNGNIAYVLIEIDENEKLQNEIKEQLTALDFVIRVRIVAGED
eukprot:180177_1